jgi:diacylglycerol O-acyltransferase / wax synthase
MERLSGLDAGLLYSESSAVPLHVCSVVELDTSTVPGGYTFQRFRSVLASRMCALPELRAKLADSQLNLDHPVWVEDKDFELSRHLHRIGLPSPGGREELADVCGDIMSVPLDRSKPLWELWVIERPGGNGDPHDSNALVLIFKVHHAAVDGVSAADLLSRLSDLEPDAPPHNPVDGPGDATGWAIAADGLLRFLARPWQLARLIPEATSMIVKTLDRAVSGTAMAAPFTAPTTPFNAKLTSARNVAFAQLDLDRVKRVKNQCGVKVNDVVMALCAGALRGYLRERAELPGDPMIAAVPSSVHDKSDRPGRNQLSGMFCSLHTDIEDPLERLCAIAESDSHAKEHSSALGSTLLVDLAQAVSRGMFGSMLNLFSHTPLTHTAIHNVVISNIAGPDTKLYICGAEVKALYPLGPIFQGSGLNITVMSLGDTLNVGIISCPRLVDDLWNLADRFDSELAELQTACA